jgi:hypothetical protein
LRDAIEVGSCRRPVGRHEMQKPGVEGGKPLDGALRFCQNADAHVEKSAA